MFGNYAQFKRRLQEYLETQTIFPKNPLPDEPSPDMGSVKEGFTFSFEDIESHERKYFVSPYGGVESKLRGG